MAPSSGLRSATVGHAWEDAVLHLGPILIWYLIYALITGISWLVYFIVYLIFVNVGGGPYSESGPMLGSVFGSIGTLPLYILACLAGVIPAAIPAVYYSTGEVVSFKETFAIVSARPLRYILAGALFSIVAGVGFACCGLPGLAVMLTMPIFINYVFNTERPVLDAFSSSFSVVYKGEGWSFVGAQLIAALAFIILAVCTCGVGALVAWPVICFYLQSLAYNKGLLSS